MGTRLRFTALRLCEGVLISLSGVLWGCNGVVAPLAFAGGG